MYDLFVQSCYGIYMKIFRRGKKCCLKLFKLTFFQELWNFGDIYQYFFANLSPQNFTSKDIFAKTIHDYIKGTMQI